MIPYRAKYHGYFEVYHFTLLDIWLFLLEPRLLVRASISWREAHDRSFVTHKGQWLRNIFGKCCPGQSIMEQYFGLFVLAVMFLLLLQTKEVLHLVADKNESKVTVILKTTYLSLTQHFINHWLRLTLCPKPCMTGLWKSVCFSLEGWLEPELLVLA